MIKLDFFSKNSTKASSFEEAFFVLLTSLIDIHFLFFCEAKNSIFVYCFNKIIKQNTIQ